MPPGLNAGNLDAVLLTHGHLDHCGRLPLLAMAGFEGPVFGTPATLEVAALILRDSAKVQAYDIERVNRRRVRAGQKPTRPLYDQDDVARVIAMFKPVEYNQPLEVASGISARYVDAGHLLGSTSIELTLRENDRRHVAVFSGDIGHLGAPLLKDPVLFQVADTVFMESTYGDREHRSLAETLAEGQEIIRDAVKKRGKILVPSFAVGRTQQLLYHLAALFHSGRVAPFPVYLDSPMAIEATRIYMRHPELYDEEATELHESGQLARDFSGVHTCQTADESRALNDLEGPILIMAGAGMCNAGRILHHLRNNLWRKETSVVIVGYQAEGTLGRQLVEGSKKVSIFGEKIAVKATVHTLGGFSAHAGQSELLDWLGTMAASRPRVILTHGEPRAQEPLAALIEQRFGLKPECPGIGDTVEL
jgi:metallo-beta-lactamase family protein